MAEECLGGRAFWINPDDFFIYFLLQMNSHWLSLKVAFFFKLLCWENAFKFHLLCVCAFSKPWVYFLLENGLGSSLSWKFYLSGACEKEVFLTL